MVFKTKNLQIFFISLGSLKDQFRRKIFTFILFEIFHTINLSNDNNLATIFTNPFKLFMYMNKRKQIIIFLY